MDNNKDDKAQTKNEFMMRMYDQMFSTIDRSYKNIWEMILAIGCGIGVLQLEGKTFFDVAVIGYIIGLFWILIRLIDTNHWYNRNLFIIHEIENQLLGNDAHTLFKGFRPNNREEYNKYHFSISLQTIFVGIILFMTYLSYIIFKYNFFCTNIGVISTWILIIAIPIILGFIFYLIYNNRKTKFNKSINPQQMNYEEFIESLKQLGDSFDVPTLGFESEFSVSIFQNSVVIHTSGNSSHTFTEEEYNKILNRFTNLLDDQRLRAKWYSQPNSNTPEIGWREESRNPNIRFFGYLPAIFRELLYKKGISVHYDANIFCKMKKKIL